MIGSEKIDALGARSPLTLVTLSVEPTAELIDIYYAHIPPTLLYCTLFYECSVEPRSKELNLLYFL